MRLRRQFRDNRYVYDILKGSWVLNTNGAANELGYNQSVSTDWSMARDDQDFRFRREERSLARNYMYDRCATLLEGSESGVRKRRLRGLHWQSRGSGFHGSSTAPVPKVRPMPNGDRPPVNIGATMDTVRRLPDCCAECVHRKSCVSWLGVSLDQPGVRPCVCATSGKPMWVPVVEVLS